MSEQSIICKRGRGRPRKTTEELAINRQRWWADKIARDSFRNKQSRGQRQRQSERIHTIQWREIEEEVARGDIAPLPSTSSNIPFQFATQVTY
jgi:AT hook motif